MDTERFNQFIVTMIMLFFFALIFSGCSDRVNTDDSWTYSIIEVDGMTCIKYNSGTYAGGLTCNWDEWKGEAR